MAPGPLHGVRVLEFSEVVAGPLAGSTLADLGAEVVKVEPPGGDAMRRGENGAAGSSKDFQFLNRGKHSLVVNLDDPRGRALIHRIVPSFDVVVINLGPVAVRERELDYETLSRLRPDLIYVQISGFGRHGPRADEPLPDLAAQAYSGYMAELGVVDEFGAPMGTHGGTIDAATGLSAVIGVNSALYHRARSGEGQLVDVASLRSAIVMIGGLVMQEPVSDSVLQGHSLEEAHERFAAGDDYSSVLRGYKATRASLAAIFGPFLGGYMAKDGPVFIGAYTPGMRAATRQVLSIPDDGGDAAGFNPLDPTVHARSLGIRQAIAEAVGRRTVNEILSELLDAGVPVSRVLLPAEVADDPQAAELMVEVEDELTGPQRQLSGIFEMSAAAVGPAGPAPVLGRHTEEILREAGLSDDEIGALREAGAVA